MILYRSGEEIKKGDRVLFHGQPGEIDFVVEAKVGDPAMDGYVNEFGSGAMVIEPKHFGRAFLPKPETAEDLVLCRGLARKVDLGGRGN